MKEFTHTIVDEFGLHARPVGQLVRLAKPFASNVTITCGEKSSDMKKLMAFMSMGVKCGQTVQVTVEGEDEDACFAAIETFFAENGL